MLRAFQNVFKLKNGCAALKKSKKSQNEHKNGEVMSVVTWQWHQIIKGTINNFWLITFRYLDELVISYLTLNALK